MFISKCGNLPDNIKFITLFPWGSLRFLWCVTTAHYIKRSTISYFLSNLLFKVVWNADILIWFSLRVKWYPFKLLLLVNFHRRCGYCYVVQLFDCDSTASVHEVLKKNGFHQNSQLHSLWQRGCINLKGKIFLNDI